MNLSILEKYRKEMENDKSNEDNSFPKDNSVSINESQRAAYEKRLNELRNSEISMENQYKRKMSELIKRSENEMKTDGNIKFTDVAETKIVRAYCPECGEEIKSTMPTMFNPYTGEKQNIYNCKCGKKYNLEYSYPRVAFFDSEGNEIKAYGL